MTGLSPYNPASIFSAFNSPTILPGDTIELLPGVYKGDYVSSFSGTIDKPIVIKPYNNGEVIFDGNLSILGDYVTIQDITGTFTGWTTRTTETPGSDAPDIEPERYWYFAKNTTKMVNCVLHNLHNGTNGAGLVYGCLFFHQGWSGPDRGHGHGTYIQNNQDTFKIVENCIAFDNFEIGFKVYQEGGVFKNVALRKNTAFNNNSPYDRVGTQNKKWNYLMGGYTLFENPELTDNRSYHSPSLGGYPSSIGWWSGFTNATVKDNYCPDGSFNEGYSAQHGPTQYAVNTGNYKGPNTGDIIFFEPNLYKPTRAHVTIFNQSLLETVVIPSDKIKGMFLPGDYVSVTNVQDYFKDISVIKVAENGTISIDMRSSVHSVKAPYLWTPSPTSFPEFGCFIFNKI